MPITEENLKKRVLNMADDFRKSVADKLQRAIDSGCIDLDEAEDNFILPKIVFTAILADGAEQYTPPAYDTKQCRAFKKQTNNIKAFL